MLGSQQRGGFREAYGDPPRCSPELLHGVSKEQNSLVKLTKFLLIDDSF